MRFLISLLKKIQNNLPYTVKYSEWYVKDGNLLTHN